MIEAAARLGWSYQQTHNAVLQGRLEGGKDGARWWVSLSSVTKLQRARHRDDA
jgi:hypothetical protein